MNIYNLKKCPICKREFIALTSNCPNCKRGLSWSDFWTDETNSQVSYSHDNNLMTFTYHIGE